MGDMRWVTGDGFLVLMLVDLTSPFGLVLEGMVIGEKGPTNLREPLDF